MPVVNSIRNLKRSYNIFSKTTLLHKVLYFLAALICISLITNFGRKSVEGFEKKTNEFDVREDIPQIYDEYYVNIYDDLVFNKTKNNYEVGKLLFYRNQMEKVNF